MWYNNEVTFNKGFHGLVGDERALLVPAWIDCFRPIYKEANIYPSGRKNLSSRARMRIIYTGKKRAARRIYWGSLRSCPSSQGAVHVVKPETMPDPGPLSFLPISDWIFFEILCKINTNEG
jgi:hypothetical protein